MLPSVKVFTRDEPCSKRNIWECFVGPTGFRTVPIPEVHSVIGVNAPRGMEREGRLALKKTPRGDYYSLTTDGREWLKKGILAYVKNHPLEEAGIAFLEFAGEVVKAAPSGRIRRVR